MILFLNFAPIQYLGGVEAWILTIHNEFKEKGIETEVIYVSPNIANIYAKLVLHRKFDMRMKKEKSFLEISLMSLIPFTKKWWEIRNRIINAQTIYSKFEVNELILLIYFGGIKILKKTVTGIRSPYKYYYPESLTDHIHNFVYKSWIIGKVLSQYKNVHTLVDRDTLFLTRKFKLRNIVQVPNFIKEKSENKLIVSNKKDLNILFIGEISHRKGIDTLIKVIEKAPNSFNFTIIGNGPLLTELIKSTKNKSNVQVKGYLQRSDINPLFEKNDLLILPSRAEGFANVILEAVANGLPVITTPACSIGFPRNIEYVSEVETEDILNNLNKIHLLKKQHKLNKKEIQSYSNRYYSKERILPRIYKEVFGITTATV